MPNYKAGANGPSWFEVIFGAALSVALGVALGVGLLAFGPVTVVKELPAEADRDPQATYFVEGSRDANKARAAAAKRKSFAEGQTVSVIEDELNVLAGPPVAFAAPKSRAAKPAAVKKAPPKEDRDSVTAGTPNFRMQDGAFQIGVPLTVNALGLGQKIVVQAKGAFVKRGDTFGFEPETIFVGACPLHRVRFLFGYAREKILAQSPPDDITASWAKLASVAIEGNTLRLKMP